MKYDMIIKNGLIIDPGQKVNKVCDIAIIDNKIAEIKENIDAKATHEIDAAGFLVVPGLIDFHTHVFSGGTDIGISPDMAYLPTGVTSAVDAGSAGTANYEAFSANIIARQNVRIKSFINVCSTGLVTTKYHENVLPQYFDRKKMNRILDKYKDEILGLKIRTSRELVKDNGLEPLKEAVQWVQELNLPLAVHTTNPPSEAGDIAELLRSGDIYVHCYQGTGHNIINSQGRVCEKIKEARKRGVIFDAANGGNHWVFKVAQAAMADGFYPDVISTDLTTKTLFKSPVHSLPYIMSKYLNMGMDIETIIAACTVRPAQFMGLENQIGTLKVNAYADIAIMKVVNKETPFFDTQQESIVGRKLLVNQLTIKNGTIVYQALDF